MLGSAVSLHSRPTGGEPLPLVPVLRLKGGFSPLGIAVKIMRMFFGGWMQKQAPLNPIMVVLAFGSWWDLKRFQNETRAGFRQTRADFANRLDPLVKEKDMRLLTAARAYLLPDKDPGRTNCYCIHAFMPEGLPVLKESQFSLDVVYPQVESASALIPTGTQKLRLTYSNNPRKMEWDLDVPEGLVVDGDELAITKWSFEVEDRIVAKLTLRRPFLTRDGAAGGSPPSTGPRPP